MGHMSWSLGLPGVSLVAVGRLGSLLSNLFSGYRLAFPEVAHTSVLLSCSGSNKDSFPMLWALGT